MTSIRQLSRFAAIASAAVTFSGAYVIYNSTRSPARASAGLVPEELYEDRLLFKPSGLRWDSNWDMCETGTKKFKKKDDGRVDYGEESKEVKPTAVRHLLFIRHGQYFESAKNNDEKRLTELGRYENELLYHSVFRVYLNDLKIVEVTRNFNDNGKHAKGIFVSSRRFIDIDHGVFICENFRPIHHYVYIY